jgi:hypothetical protein
MPKKSNTYQPDQQPELILELRADSTITLEQQDEKGNLPPAPASALERPRLLPDRGLSNWR